MKIEILNSVAGVRFAYPRGVFDVPKERAEMLIRAGHAKSKSQPRKKKRASEAVTNGGSDDVGDGTK